MYFFYFCTVIVTLILIIVALEVGVNRIDLTKISSVMKLFPWEMKGKEEHT